MTNVIMGKLMITKLIMVKPTKKIKINEKITVSK